MFLLIFQGAVDEFIDFSLEQKHSVAQHAQVESAELAMEDKSCSSLMESATWSRRSSCGGRARTLVRLFSSYVLNDNACPIPFRRAKPITQRSENLLSKLGSRGGDLKLACAGLQAPH